MKKILPHLYTWNVFNESKGLNFNGHYLRGGHHAFLIDPPPMSEADHREAEDFGIPHRIYLTNKHHTRAAEQYRKDWGCKIFIHQDDASLVELPVDGTFSDGELIEDELEAIRIPDAKTPGECAFHWIKNGVLILGDALLGKPAGALSMLSDDKFKDPTRAKHGLSVLRGLQYDILLVGDGESILNNAKGVVEGFLNQIQTS